MENWLQLVQIIVLGIVQGISEFLPISSDGHLVIAQGVLDASLGKAFTPGGDLERIVALHIGTLGALALVYARDLPDLLRQPWQIATLVIATIPAVIIGLTCDDFLEATFTSPLYAGMGLLVTAVLLWVGQANDQGQRSIREIGLGLGAIIGCFQALAPLPGVSRSGSTIAGGLLCGVERNAAAKFSFWMAIPVTAGAIALKLKDALEKGSTETPVSILAIGVVVSFVVGWLALNGLLALIPRRKLHWFALYCLCAGVATIAWQLTKSAAG